MSKAVRHCPRTLRGIPSGVFQKNKGSHKVEFTFLRHFKNGARFRNTSPRSFFYRVNF
jgi:hypothetical protein